MPVSLYAEDETAVLADFSSDISVESENSGEDSADIDGIISDGNDEAASGEDEPQDVEIDDGSDFSSGSGDLVLVTPGPILSLAPVYHPSEYNLSSYENRAEFKCCKSK